MAEDYLVLKSSDQKGSKEYEYFRTLEINEGTLNEESFNQFIELEREDKNMAFFVTDSIKFLSYTDTKKFYKNFLKTYKETINDNDLMIYLYLRDEKLKDNIDILLEGSGNVIDLTKNDSKTK